MDGNYTNGVIAVKEKSLLGEKLLRFAEMGAEEAFRALTESGFGSGAEAASYRDGESLCAAEERVLDGFIREYAPTRAIAEYLLAPRDFHNMKALVKAKLLGQDPAAMLAPEGLIPLSALQEGLDTGLGLPLPMQEAAARVLQAEEVTGAQVGAAFDGALFAHLKREVRTCPLLKKLLAGRADRTNILTALRAADREFAETLYVTGGTLKAEELGALFGPDARERFGHTPYGAFAGLALDAKEKGLPFTEAERRLGSFEAEYFAAHRYELEGKEPFLYYVFRRRAEIANVRILLVCLGAGLGESDVKKRLRAVF